MLMANKLGQVRALENSKLTIMLLMPAIRPLSHSHSEAALPMSKPPTSELIRVDVAIIDEIRVKKYGRHTIIVERIFIA